MPSPENRKVPSHLGRGHAVEAKEDPTSCMNCFILSAHAREARWCFFCDKHQGSPPPLPLPKHCKKGLAATVAALAQQVEGLTAKINTNSGPSNVSFSAGPSHRELVRLRVGLRGGLVSGSVRGVT